MERRDRDGSGVHEGFDFTPVAETVMRVVLDAVMRKKSEGNSDGLLDSEVKKLFVQKIFERFPEYLVFYLNHEADYFSVQGRKLKHYPSSGDDVLRRTQKFVTGKTRQNRLAKGFGRHAEQYSLLKGEVNKALDYNKDHQLWPLAVSLFQEIVVSFMKGLGKKLEENQVMDTKTIETGVIWGTYEALISEADGTSFLREFVPPMSLSLSQEGAEITEKTLAKALCETFRMHAFRSSQDYYVDYMSGSDELRERVTHCPFGPLLGTYAGLVLQEDERGEVYLSEERRPGALFFFLYQRAALLKREHEARISGVLGYPYEAKT